MRKEDLRIVFMGTPEFAVETLQALVENGYNVVAVVTQPDKPVGRHGSVLQAPAVKQYALSKGLPVLQPEKMKDPAFIEELKAFNANLQVVVAFRMLPEVVWAMPEYGTFNVHAALLPQYRGAAPINWAVINGEKQTGVTTFFLDHDIDTGRIIMQLPFDIADDYDVEDVYNGLMRRGADICLKTLDKIIESDGYPQSISQDDLIVKCGELHHAPKIFKETCMIEWTKNVKQIYDFIRGLSPYPAAWICEMPSSHPLATMLKGAKVYKAAITHLPEQKGHIIVPCAQGYIDLLELQLPGKKRMDAPALLNGLKNSLNTQL